MPLTVFFFSSAEIIGGAERSLQSLVLALSEKGLNCVMVTSPQAPLKSWAQDQGLMHESFSTDTLRQRNPLVALRQVSRNRRFARTLVQKYGGGVFYANHRHSFILLASLPRKYPTIAHHRDIVSRRVNQLLYPRIDRNIFVSNFNYRRSDAPKNGQVIHNAAAYFCDDPAVVLESPSSAIKLAMFARITPYKGHQLALEACQELEKNRIGYTLDVWGDPGGRREEQQLYDKLKLVAQTQKLNVNFCGFHPQPENVMRDYHCVLNPSKDEPFGRIPVESFSLGVSSISHASGGSLEIYSGLKAYQDFLFDEYSAHSLYEAIVRRIEASALHDVEVGRLNDLRTDICDRFGIERLADEIEAVIREVATKKKILP